MPTQYTVLSHSDVEVLRGLGYEVELAGGRHRVRPPATKDWIADKRKVLRELRRCRRSPEAAKLLHATALLSPEDGYRLWRESVRQDQSRCSKSVNVKVQYQVRKS